MGADVRQIEPISNPRYDASIDNLMYDQNEIVSRFVFRYLSNRTIMSERESCRFTNLIYGAVAGTIFALLTFGAAYPLNVKEPPIGANMQTVRAFIEFVPWPWFGGIVVFFALIGLIFNMKLVYTWSDVVNWFH